MIAVLQRVSRACVRVGDEVTGAIEGGLLVLLGVKDGDPAEAEASATHLQQRGMWKDCVERGLGYSGSNSICTPTKQKRAAEWIKQNVVEMSEHRIVIDDDLDGSGLAINMY